MGRVWMDPSPANQVSYIWSLLAVGINSKEILQRAMIARRRRLSGTACGMQRAREAFVLLPGKDGQY